MEPKSCPLIKMANIIADKKEQEDKCIQTNCAWYNQIQDGPNYAASCALGWLGHVAILDAMLDRKVPNAEPD